MRFSEHQLFPNWIRFGLILVAFCSTAIMVYTETHRLLIGSSAVIMTIVAITFYIWNLQTTIDSRNISIEIKPFVKKSFPLADIKEWEVRRYGPIAEYGGWGVRYSANGTAYNVRGNIGLDLVFNENTKLLIGTQRGKEIKRILKAIIPEKERTIDA